MTLRRALLRLASLALALAATDAAYGAESCEAQLAATHDFRNGLPTDVTPLPDGGIVYLRSLPRDMAQALYRFDPATGERLLASPASLAGGANVTLSVEERARRERARIVTTGLAGYDLSKDGRLIATVFGGRLYVVPTEGGPARKLGGSAWLTPHLSPDGRFVAGVRDNDVHIVDLATGAETAATTGGSDTVTHGLAEFAAEEELDRLDGFWWSPDSNRILYEEADNRPVEMHYIADPAQPSHAPVGFRYPRAGTPNAITRLGLVARTGGATTWVAWDRDAFPYVARVVWPAHGALSLVVLDRTETHERVLAVDTTTGATHVLLEEQDPAWIDVTPFARNPGELALPHWRADGSGFLWAAERGGTWQLELRHADGSLDHAVTPPGFRWSALYDVDRESAVIAGGPDRLSELLYRVPLAGGTPVPLAAERGLHNAAFGTQHAGFADHENLADGSNRVVLRDDAGAIRATLPSAAEAPPSLPRVTWTQAGSARFDADIIHPHDWTPGRRLPVILAVYAGPGFKVVRAARREFLADQCLADHGAIVVSLDGRGTPGRDHDFERATKFDLIDDPLDDQIAGLRALAASHPEMDMSRVAVMGWSFGGYFTAMATIRHPEIFRAGVAGAPVVDWHDYDTAYTERYLGLPDAHPDAYRTSSVLTYARGLARPLMIVHGLTDDNVYFENTVQLTDALLRAGKPYRLVLLPGTHMLADPALREAEAAATDAFLRETIGLAH